MSDEAVVATIKLCERIIRDKNRDIDELRGNRDGCLGSMRLLLDAKDQRIADLLASNNQYLHRARDAEKHAQELEGKIAHLRDDVGRLKLNAQHVQKFVMSCVEDEAARGRVRASDSPGISAVEMGHYYDTMKDCT